MTDSRRTASGRESWGDAAVDGLLAGAGGGLVMGLYLIVVSMLSSVSWEDTLAHFDPTSAGSAFTGALAHLAVAGVYGVIFGVGWRLAQRLPIARRLPTWLAGLAYGLALWLLALAVTRSGVTSGMAAWLRAFSPLHVLAAHVT